VNDTPHDRDARKTPPGILRGVMTIVLAGTALGVAYNAMGLISRPAWGLSWVAVDRVSELPSLEASGLDAFGVTDTGSFSTSVTDPMAIGVAPQKAANVPEVPDLDRPMQIQLAAAKQFFDADAALFVDSREEDEYATGRIPGAISLTFDEATAAPELLAGLDPQGRPIITYCGGGACELSVSVAWEILFAGNTKVMVYMGGFPDWVEAGFPVESGGEAGEGPR
jgi:rhodanese-related sulfurtransferase